MREAVGHPTLTSIMTSGESCKVVIRVNVEFHLWIIRRDDFLQHLDVLLMPWSGHRDINAVFWRPAAGTACSENQSVKNKRPAHDGAGLFFYALV